jgi:hypothetical protein
MLVADEQLERIRRVSQDGDDGLQSNVRENIVRGDATADPRGGVPPGCERELLQASETSGGRPIPTGIARIRLWRCGHEYPSGWLSALSVLLGTKSSDCLGLLSSCSTLLSIAKYDRVQRSRSRMARLGLVTTHRALKSWRSDEPSAR